MTWEPDDADVVAEILSAELGAYAGGLSECQYLLLQLDIAEALAARRAFCRNRVEVVRRCQLRSFDCELG